MIKIFKITKTRTYIVLLLSIAVSNPFTLNLACQNVQNCIPETISPFDNHLLFGLILLSNAVIIPIFEEVSFRGVFTKVKNSKLYFALLFSVSISSLYQVLFTLSSLLNVIWAVNNINGSIVVSSIYDFSTRFESYFYDLIYQNLKLPIFFDKLFAMQLILFLVIYVSIIPISKSKFTNLKFPKVFLTFYTLIFLLLHLKESEMINIFEYSNPNELFFAVVVLKVLNMAIITSFLIHITRKFSLMSGILSHIIYNTTAALCVAIFFTVDRNYVVITFLLSILSISLFLMQHILLEKVE